MPEGRSPKKTYGKTFQGLQYSKHVNAISVFIRVFILQFNAQEANPMTITRVCLEI